MARPKKNRDYNADAATIQRYFDEAMELKRSQKANGREISSLNSMMQDDGVEPGVLSLFCRIAAMPDAKAVLYLTLIEYYSEALASRLPNPKSEAEAEASTKEASPVPFGDSARGAAAA